ncbi:MAG: hypothetical protein ABFC77_03970 [Thermoguttaceae bacterium]
MGESVATNPSAKDLPALCQKAKSQYHPLTQSDVDQAKTALTAALERLTTRLEADGANGQAWRKFLDLDALAAQLQTARPDRAVVGRTLVRCNSGHDGLDLVWFVDFQRALHNYLATCGAVDNNPAIRAAFEQKLDALSARLKSYAVRPTTEGALEITETVRWLASAHQAPELVRAILRGYVHPNLIGEMSAAVFGSGIAGPVDDTSDVRDCILKTDIHGTARTVGKTSVALSPSGEFGVFDTLFAGVTTSENVGYNGPVTIYSTSTTQMTARKRLWVDANGLSSHPAESCAATDVNIQDIQSKNGNAMIERLAWKKAGKQQSEAESIASSHAESRLNDRIDQQADEMIERANRSYVEKFQQPFTERKLFPQMVHFSTTERAISLTALQAGDGKLAAVGEAPAVAPGAEMSLRVHESMINNLAFDALAGRTIYEQKVQAAVTDTLGKLPEKMKGDDDGKPWAITFAPRQPISLTLVDNGFTITIRGVKFYKGGDAHPGMNISATYKVERSGKGFKAVRQGDIEVLPPDFKPGKQIDARRQVIRKLLQKRFAKIFEPEIFGDGFELPGKWKVAGKMTPIQVAIKDGWLTIAWRRADPEK